MSASGHEPLVMPQSWWESGLLPPEGGVPSRAGTPPSGGSSIKPAATEALTATHPFSFTFSSSTATNSHDENQENEKNTEP